MKSLYTSVVLILITSFCLNAQTIMNIHQSNGTILQIPLNTIDSITYTINNPGQLATISTLPIGNISSNSAVSGGNISNNGGTTITQRGIVWSTLPNPTTADNLTNNGNGVGNFISDLAGLQANTIYYTRAYAINSAGTAYGDELNFTTLEDGGMQYLPHSCGVDSVHNINLNYGSMTDQDGNIYKTIVIGGKEWMAENLFANHFRNGEIIELVADGGTWDGMTSAASSWMFNDSLNYNCPYGKLYNWYAVSDPREICPTGWHMPTDAEWNELISVVDPNYNPTATSGIAQSIIAGGLLASESNRWINSSNNFFSNEYGFSALPSGYRDNNYVNGSFSDISYYSYFWSGSQYGPNTAYYRFIQYNNSEIFRNNITKVYGMSVRCVRD
jgi:uncharacterized protein (TIGR02145 family)